MYWYTTYRRRHRNQALPSHWFGREPTGEPGALVNHISDDKGRLMYVELLSTAVPLQRLDLIPVPDSERQNGDMVHFDNISDAGAYTTAVIESGHAKYGGTLFGTVDLLSYWESADPA